MKHFTSKLMADDGLMIYIHNWLPDNIAPQKLLFLVHGSVEHAKRYEHLAEELTLRGYVVIAPDKRGHGLTALESGEFSHLGDKDGFLRALKDLGQIFDHLNKEYRELPKAIFGHSWGSFITRKFISERGDEFKAAIISGTTCGNYLELKGGLFFSSVLQLFIDKNKPSQFYNDFFWATINNKVKDRKGKIDFISRDENEIRKYEEDPLTGKTMTIEFGKQMASAILMLRDDKIFRNTPKDINLQFISGTGDPLSNDGKDIIKLAEKYRKAGVKNIELKLYIGGRHEMINEINKNEVINDILIFLNKHL